MALTVGRVARLARVSVRTLHHYDEMGLLRPSARSDAGYRLYDDSDLQRLQQILLYRELGFSLEDIAGLLDDPSFGRREALLGQRELLEARAARLMRMIAAVDDAVTALEEGTKMNAEDMFEVFGDFDPAEHEDEARERWGDTDAYKESARRTSRYTKQDWQQIRDESDRVTAALAELLDDGVAPEDDRAMDLAEEHRRQIDRYFYPCSHEMHAGLGEMYVADPRFSATYDQVRPGLAEYLRDAIVANALRHV